MSKLTQRLKTHRFATLAFSMALLGILAGAMLNWSGKANNSYERHRQETIPVRITSQTSAVRVVSIERVPLGTQSMLAVKLQNTSGKEIKAYTIASGKTWVTTSYFLDEESFAPGAIIIKHIPLPSDAPQDFNLLLNGTEFSVTAVYFADSTGDGVSRYVSALADQHDGIRDQANRILPCLRGLSSTVGQELAVAACEGEALRLPVKMDGKSSDYEGGLENAKREVLRHLKDIKEKVQAVHLTEALGRQEKITRILQRLAETSR
ncbi:MAG: hypothetical protein H7Z16_00850 [Pyrinomonadaceae bacterium]|nr:hypothetical protein [Pyrinomonadaceae bacterium]